MSNIFAKYHFHRRLSYPFVSLLMAFGIIISSPEVSLAIPWLELLLQGAQVVQLYNISDEEEVQLGKQINQQLISSGQVELYSDRKANTYVNRIGQRLAANSTRPNIPYTFQVVRDDSINAFATAGGYVYVTTGLMRAADNEAQLAAVLAHEIGHIASRHSIEQMRQTAIARGLANAAGLDRSTAVQLGVELALQRPRSRQDEYEADRRGIETLTRTGYDPRAMIAFLQKLRNQPSPPTFLSTHPAPDDRIAALKREIDS
ncbi:peptidase [Scytonema hofmannii PCC 7110]|uniref:Peptidase n=1 Tax=Scytonema hofmannii PCC 7110 TaxID=128403 RepID=A0A139XHP3_9CYAN|nr:M48 family metallopeptidase [Scytonema hofmannii]KYC44201.1 peptidase [Scytonema hofmannii PCC 7110]